LHRVRRGDIWPGRGQHRKIVKFLCDGGRRRL